MKEEGSAIHIPGGNPVLARVLLRTPFGKESPECPNPKLEPTVPGFGEGRVNPSHEELS